MRSPDDGTVPEGYLGSDARITSGPAPELVAAGYALELADAPLLHEGLSLADLAHVMALGDLGLLPGSVEAELLAVLLDVATVPAGEFPYDARLGDAYNSRERELTRRAGDLAGWVHLGRTRREAGRIAFRLAARTLLLDLATEVCGLVDAIAQRATELVDATWADWTYLQPAQPSTFGHYLASFAEEGVRHLERLRAAYRWLDVSPAGSGGVAGTRLGLDRAALAAALGFSAVGHNTRDTMWNVDGLIDVVAAATHAALTCDRLAEDLQLMASPALGLVELDASVCRASVLMPQKRNPYALSVVRSSANALAGRLAGVVASARTPSASTDNWLHAYGEVSSALVLSARTVALTTAVVRTLHVDRAALRRTADDEQIAATDVADELVTHGGIDYRTAYRVVGRAVASSIADGLALSWDNLDEAARTLTGRPLDVAAGTDLSALLDPDAVVASRTEVGGCGPAALSAELAALPAVLDEARSWVIERRRADGEARSALERRAAERATGAVLQ